MDLAILRELDKYQRVLPNLKHVRGDGWEDKHWRQLFGLLGLPTKGPKAVDATTLTLGHFLSAADALAAKADEIGGLDAQAQGEHALQKAIKELETWGFERVFTFMPYESAHGGDQVSATCCYELPPPPFAWLPACAPPYCAGCFGRHLRRAPRWRPQGTPLGHTRWTATCRSLTCFHCMPLKILVPDKVISALDPVHAKAYRALPSRTPDPCRRAP